MFWRPPLAWHIVMFAHVITPAPHYSFIAAVRNSRSIPTSFITLTITSVADSSSNSVHTHTRHNMSAHVKYVTRITGDKNETSCCNGGSIGPADQGASSGAQVMQTALMQAAAAAHPLRNNPLLSQQLLACMTDTASTASLNADGDQPQLLTMAGFSVD